MLRGTKGDMDKKGDPDVIDAPAADGATVLPPADRGLRRGMSLLRERAWPKRQDQHRPPALVDVEPETAPPLAQGGGRRRPPSWFLLSFIGCVVIPAIGYLIYLFAFASDQYVALARFSVRTAALEQQVELPSNSANRTSNFGLPMVVGQDSYLVVAYINSHKIIEDLSPTINLRAMFRHPRADFWERLSSKASAEDLLTYWQQRVQASVDGPSGIVTVRVRAFTPDDSLALLKGILAASEKLANDVSARARRDTVARFEEEVRRAVGTMQEALQALREFREKVGFVDPVSSATMTNTLLLQMLGEKIKLENELFVMQRVSPDNATGLRVLRTNIQTVDQQIDRLKASLTGASAEGRSIAGALVQYEGLELQRVFSQKMLGLAQEALTRANQRAERQNIYVSVFVPPSLPEESRFPERWSMSVVVPLSMVVVWGIFALLAATIRDHRE
jgi:capsular polysaccharide transport system permease protein